MKNNPKLWVVGLAASAAFFTSLINHEGVTSKPVIPVKGDKPTIGIGSTKYENGTPVKMTDKPISKERAVQIAKAHISKDEAYFRKSLPGVKLTQVEYDLYLDFMYQFGQSAWSGSSMRRLILQGKPRQACDALLKWKYVAKRDCSIRSNGCYGVWVRQIDRYQKCVGANS
ncbi:glycoside hydrolase family protein [Acinetobacter calcoaceticus]|uniref:glycoside hydrolase family protein n=1 Tax=Acinetobacter calcoaceticus TaxID=471 RepID=UPI000FD72F42|nr:glycoside hydrolase family protein [Acinetobacter calcoaceticus]